MSAITAFENAFAELPLIAVLRGLKPDEAEDVGEALVEAGFTLMEVTLNSPDPLESVHRLARRMGNRAVVGAGTVLCVDDVIRVEAAGGRMIISPNTDEDVIRATVARGLVSLPGVFTPSEAFAAHAAGATALKLFPAEGGNPSVLKALRAVLPKDARVLPVGGITPESMASWSSAGAAGFGMGSALYKPGASPSAVRTVARTFIKAWRRT